MRAVRVSTSVGARKTSRLVWGGIAIVSAFSGGFLVGGLVGRELVPPGAGFSAGTIVLGYAAAGAVAGALAAIVASWRLEARLLRRIAIVLAAATIATAMVLAGE